MRMIVLMIINDNHHFSIGSYIDLGFFKSDARGVIRHRASAGAQMKKPCCSVTITRQVGKAHRLMQPT